MDMNILQASMSHTKEDGYIGRVEFEVSGHKESYEITLHSKKGDEWSYGLFFSKQSGNEEEIMAVEDWLEEDDEAYFRLVDAAMNTLADHQK